ncbi:hypothetical protein AMECASPLE_023311 [Ameca splendens]|uniref:Uncharacterized protein n=1 Tax=Ameca splendens TaxID=208324 RepID=A0ABV0Y3Y8_9TELE
MIWLFIFSRPQLCPKRASSCTSSNSEVEEGVQSTAAEISELQLMAENQAGPEMTIEQDNCSQPRAVAADGDGSQNAEVDLSCSGLTELDIDADEVFIVSSAGSPGWLPFYPHAPRSLSSRNSSTLTLVLQCEMMRMVLNTIC